MVIIKRNLKGVLADQVEREFNEYVKQNSRCPKGTVEPDSFKCGNEPTEKTDKPAVKIPSTPSDKTQEKLKNALDNENLPILKRNLFTNPLSYNDIKPVDMPESERNKIFNKLAGNRKASTGSDTGKRFESIVRSIKSPKDFEDGLKKLSDLVKDVSHDESNKKVSPGSTKDLIKYIAAQKYRFEKTKTKSNESGNPEEVKQNLRCPKDSYEQGTFKCDPSMSTAVKNKEAKETAKQGLDKDKDLTLREKSLKQATGMMSDLSGKYEALKKELQDKKKGMSNPDSPRNKKQLREIEKKMKAVGDNMDRIQKAMDKNSRGFNSEKKKPGDGAMKRIAEQVDAEGMKKRESENKSAKDTAKAEKAIKEFNKKIDSVRGSKKHGSNIEDDAKEMGLEPWQIQIAKDEGVTTLIGLRTLEKNTRGLKNREEYERDKMDSAFPWRSASEKTFEKASERYPDKKASTTVVASGNSFKITGKGFDGETYDNLVEGLTSRKEAENVAEMIVENTPPGVMAADINKPVFAVTKGRETTEDGDPIVSVKFWRQDGLLHNFAVVQRNGEWDFPVTDKVTGVDIEKNIDMIKSAIDKAEDGKESPMWIGKRLPESRFKK